MQASRIYDRLFESCTTENQLNQVHIHLENRMTPAEVRELAAHVERLYAPDGQATALPGRGPLVGHACQWAAGLLAQLGRAGDRGRSELTRTWIRGGATLYRRSGAPSGTLLVCLTGNARRMMMPTPLFLQQVAAFDVDVLKLEGRSSRGYVDGVPGHGRDFAGTLRWLADLVSDHGSPRLAVMGTSLGGLPAILAGLALPASAILAAGAMDYGIPELSLPPGSEDLEGLLAGYAAGRSPLPALSLVTSDSVPRDVDAARRIAAVLPCREVVAVPAPTHNCLYPLVQRDELGGLLARTLFSEE